MFRILGYFFSIGIVLLLLVAAGTGLYLNHMSDDLPDYEFLSRYEPPVMTRLHASDGELMAEFARERRLFLPIAAIPDLVKAAFLSAEDKNFYNHPGIDITGLARALLTNVQNLGSGRRPVGASTITQQVAKNFLLTADQTVERKITEMLLSFRIEQAYSKDRILELYLNEIWLGLGSFGVAGASLAYFDKAVGDLSISEAAYLAALPKGPNNYHPFRYTARAVERRNWVIDQMHSNGFITIEEATAAKSEDLGVKQRGRGPYLFAADYFTEEVRRDIIARYGEDALYEGGLSVRTTLDPQTQLYARKALQDGLMKYDTLRGFHGAINNVEVSGDWGADLNKIDSLSDVPEWRLAVVLSSDKTGVSIGLRPEKDVAGNLPAERELGMIKAADMQWAMRHTVNGKLVKANSPAEVLKPGDVIYAERKSVDGEDWRLRQVPKVGGALVAMDPHTGRVLAMVGGFSFAQSQFNRATQAMRQPGSAFKPIIYAAALDNGYTPASVVMDGPLTVQIGSQIWEPKNYGGTFGGPSTLRAGIERSRNLMTVRLAQDMGMSLVAEYAERFGVYNKMPQHLSMSLGSGETTVMRMVSAFAVMANGGKFIQPSLIDRIQDRYGKTVYKHDRRQCDGCNAETWHNQAEPQLIDERDQVLDPMTAYQITSMMEGVIQRGTATSLAELGHPIAGKTGTTNEEKDAWFIGYTHDLVVGVFMGFDQPKPMGKGSTGGGLAAPIFKSFMTDVLKDKAPVEFRVPDGMHMVAIDRKTGMHASSGQSGVIMEAFKPGTGPADTYWVIGDFQVTERTREISPQAGEAINRGSGGLF